MMVTEVISISVQLEVFSKCRGGQRRRMSRGNLCEEFGRDLVLDLRKRVAAASGLEKLLGNLCAVFGRGWDIDFNMSKRIESDSGLEHFSGDLCAFFCRNVDLNLSTRVEVTEVVLIVTKSMEHSVHCVHDIPQWRANMLIFVLFLPLARTSMWN